MPVAVIEKGKVAGAHLLSGANMRPSAMRELFPDLDPSDWPVYEEVTKDAVYLLTSKQRVPLKPPPPNFRNHGNYVTSIAKLGRFLGEKAEEAGVYLLTETAADKLLVSDRIVRGVRSGDKGRDREGEPLPNFEPGSDVVAKATVLAEGTQGHLTGAAIDYFELQGLQPQRWELGVKEVWKVPKPLDRVIHTMGWPLRKSPRYNEFGGSFIYPMGEDKVCIGLVVGLDYTDATFSVHDALQELKTHPFVRKILEGGERVAWGAKTIPSGGYWALPRKVAVPGMVMCGDNAGMCNVSELKGIHYAMHAGMYAAEEIVAALKRDSVNFDAYDERVRDSAIAEDLYRWRNVRQSFSKGFFFGGVIARPALVTRRPVPARALEAARGLQGGDDDREGRRRLPEARQQVHLRQALLGVRLGQRDPRRRPQPHSRPARGAEGGRAGLGLDVPGAGLRDPGGSALERRRRRWTSTSRRRTACSAARSPPRGPPDAARGRRRPPLPGDLTRPAPLAWPPSRPAGGSPLRAAGAGSGSGSRRRAASRARRRDGLRPPARGRRRRAAPAPSWRSGSRPRSAPAPPIVPSAISASTRSSVDGRSARSAWTRSSRRAYGASEATGDRRVDERRDGPEGASPSARRASGEARAVGPSPSETAGGAPAAAFASPHASASSTARFAAGSAGKRRGSGR